MKSFILWLLGKLSMRDKAAVLQHLLNLAMHTENDLHIEIKLNEESGLQSMTAFTGNRGL